MKQYLDLLRDIKDKGTLKQAARENMPGTISLFGYQIRYNLADGFPILTTKKLSFKNIVTELLWFLRGDTNIKYLVDNGCNIWNEDAYNYYKKYFNKNIYEGIEGTQPLSFDQFIKIIKESTFDQLDTFDGDYILGDCGFQYGRVWRKWERVYHDEMPPTYDNTIEYIDQIKILIERCLRNAPESRRHILTSIDPAHDNELALYWRHCLAQFNCRPLSHNERVDYALKNCKEFERDKHTTHKQTGIATSILDKNNIPKYYLDCQMYQRSADVFLGVPYNIASYALLTHILCELCNMIPGEFIHTFGDVHIYENHIDQVNEQLARTPQELPKLKIMFKDLHELNFEQIENLFNKATYEDFQLMNYDPYPAIKAPLSTGLIK